MGKEIRNHRDTENTEKAAIKNILMAAFSVFSVSLWLRISFPIFWCLRV